MSLEFIYEANGYEGRSAQEGWGRCMLKINGRPIWFAGSLNDPQPFEWIWTDFLLQLAKNWIYLKTESPWPYEWISAVMQSGGDFWAAAERRWRVLAEEVGDVEEKEILRFSKRHDLSAGLQGANLPAVFCYKQGKSFLVVVENEIGFTEVPFEEMLRAVEGLANQIFSACSGGNDQKVSLAREAWIGRDTYDLSERISISTGFSPQSLREIAGSTALGEFWELEDGAQDQDFERNDLLAAARLMSALPAQEVGSILMLLRGLRNFVSCPELDALALKVQQGSLECQAAPYDQGYLIARNFRGEIGLSDDNPFSPEEFLRRYEVELRCKSLPSRKLEAIAVWGNRGPSILVNVRGGMRPSTAHGRRFTICHEICHLLIDRCQSLPAAEVLGGMVSPSVEKRANAFAAEVLLPREAAASMYRASVGVRSAIGALSKKYLVSKQVAAMQIYNSGAASAGDALFIQRVAGWM